MLGEFLNAVSAVVVLLMLMAVGYFMGTKGWMKAEEKKFLSKYIINIAVPCNCINGLLNNLDQSMLAQVVSGCGIGAGITRDQIFQLRQLILPALVLIAGYILVCVGMGRAISKAFRMDLKESMLSLSPAGATEMALIAADLGVHSTNLVVLQICRLLGVTVIFPQIFALLSNLIG